MRQDGPPGRALAEVAAEAAGCRACPLWKAATQTVFGEGDIGAPLMLVGEQPGDQEDRKGRPFVGPAGRVLDQALERAGVDRSAVYVTNAVKHFKFTQSAPGKRRLHKRPNVAEVAACRPWLDAELRHVRPSVVVCMGATAARALLGPDVRVTEDRGRPVLSEAGHWMIPTVHPSSLLRLREASERDTGVAALAADLRTAADLSAQSPAPGTGA